MTDLTAHAIDPSETRTTTEEEGVEAAEATVAEAQEDGVVAAAPAPRAASRL